MAESKLMDERPELCLDREEDGAAASAAASGPCEEGPSDEEDGGGQSPLLSGTGDLDGDLCLMVLLLLLLVVCESCLNRLNESGGRPVEVEVSNGSSILRRRCGGAGCCLSCCSVLLPSVVFEGRVCG